ncbi:MAG: ABC-F family ATP-binding cassette domain-containing protein [Herpetosiphonaceae bacterium]|nr:ABC-F family ATP-binding cassette domain-containing protein [Herpetosiphonaceae bacterium]
MLQVHNLYKSYGSATVLAGISFVINDGEHVGLIGPNGAGKTTLLRCIVDQEQPDAGTVTRAPQDLVIGYLPQAAAAMNDMTVAASLAAAQAPLLAAEAALQQTTEALGSTDDLDTALAAYAEALEHFEALGGYEREHRAAAIANGLGLGDLDPGLPVAVLSGGQKTRLGLATLLLQEPDLLVLDEPTNHLDTLALEWLEGFVQGYRGGVLVVSHDRAFLDRTVTRTLYLDLQSRTIRSYPGNYSAFAAARAAERERQGAAWQDQQLYVAAVEADIGRIKGDAQKVQAGPKRGRDYYGGVSSKLAKQAKARERKLERYLQSAERVEKPRSQWELKLDFGPPPQSGRAVLRIEELAFGYPDAPLLFHDLTLDVQYGERIALVGPNGAGKTTLLRLIEGRLEPAAGQIRLGTNVRIGVLAQEHETLDIRRTVLATVLHERAMSETEARNFLHFFLFAGDSVHLEVGACSLGERSRLQLAVLVLRGCNLLLLDEPLNHLDIESREHFEDALNAFEGTVIAVAHDRAFLRSFAERVVEVRDGQARVLEGPYRESNKT